MAAMLFRQSALVGILLLFYIAVSCVARGEKDAYEILQVPRDASQDDIRRQYRKLCLKYHPDKNVHMKRKDREKCEELFKRVQTANAQIGDEVARRRYDYLQQSSFSSSSTNPNPFTMGADRNAFYRSFMQQHYSAQQERSQGAQRTPFYFNGVDISDLFTRNYPSSFWGGGNNGPQLKSIFVQRVQVPLQDLYTGKEHVDMILNDNVWKRYRAAIRGGIAKAIFFQSLLFSVPLVRLSIPVSMICTAILCHVNMPQPVKLDYVVNIQKGWKSGTKLTFQESEPGMDVVFVLQEQKHARYTRVGNDLQTTITIRKRQAKDGCTIEIEPLGPFDDPISLRLRPNQITKSGQTVTIRGKGWPRRRKGGGGHGDLIIAVNIQSTFASNRQPPKTKRTTSI